MKTVAALALMVFASGCATSRSATPDPRVAVVDMARAIRECRDGQNAKEDLMKTFHASQATLDRRQEEIRGRMEKAKRDRASGLDPSDEEAAIKRDIDAVQLLYFQLQKQLKDAEERRTAIIQARVEGVLNRVKAARRIDHVLIVSPVPAGDPRMLDLTADVIRAADALPPLPAAPQQGDGASTRL